MNNSRHIIISAAALSLTALVACAPETETETESGIMAEYETGSEDAAPEAASPDASSVDEAGPSSAAVALEGEALFVALQTAPGLQITSTETWMILDGAMEAPSSSGRTSGARLDISAPVADTLAGQTITVTIVARSMNGSGLRAAYSTAQAGNSGWRDLALSESFAPVSFQYDVPWPEAGDVNTDYLGLAPDGGAVEIASVAISAGG